MKYVYACISFKNKNEIKDITKTRKYKRQKKLRKFLMQTKSLPMFVLVVIAKRTIWKNCFPKGRTSLSFLMSLV